LLGLRFGNDLAGVGGDRNVYISAIVGLEE
jgi:hypothetical protein